MKKSDEENFYSELDSKTKKKSWCSCQTMSIGFLIIIVILAIFIYFLLSA